MRSSALKNFLLHYDFHHWQPQHVSFRNWFIKPYRGWGAYSLAPFWIWTPSGLSRASPRTSSINQVSPRTVVCERPSRAGFSGCIFTLRFLTQRMAEVCRALSRGKWSVQLPFSVFYSLPGQNPEFLCENFGIPTSDTTLASVCSPKVRKVRKLKILSSQQEVMNSPCESNRYVVWDTIVTLTWMISLKLCDYYLGKPKSILS